MILIAFTLFHVVLSLVGIGSGFVVVYGMLTSRRLDGWTALFLATTAATSVTGYLFPVHRFTPGHPIGIVSLIVLALAIVGRYRFGLAGGWRGTYAVTAVAALYLNVFVLIAQLFMKVPALKAIAPTQSAPAFQIAQLCNLLLFLAIGVGAARRFHGEPQAAAAR